LKKLALVVLGLVLITSPASAAICGNASYYGADQGTRTASGQRFNQNSLTAAHRTLPFGTKLNVTYHTRHVQVTVNDRGPFIHRRILDLSRGAARVLGLIGAGVGRICFT
jgi:peptidoglycan lytic transglycosylase